MNCVRGEARVSNFHERGFTRNVESVWYRHDKNKGQYNGKRLGTMAISFMFFNFPEEWGMENFG